MRYAYADGCNTRTGRPIIGVLSNSVNFFREMVFYEVSESKKHHEIRPGATESIPADVNVTILHFHILDCDVCSLLFSAVMRIYGAKYFCIILPSRPTKYEPLTEQTHTSKIVTSPVTPTATY